MSVSVWDTCNRKSRGEKAWWLSCGLAGIPPCLDLSPLACSIGMPPQAVGALAFMSNGPNGHKGVGRA